MFENLELLKQKYKNKNRNGNPKKTSGTHQIEMEQQKLTTIKNNVFLVRKPFHPKL